MWKDLKMSEKNDIIAYAVSQGITDIDDIRKYYQEGNLFGGGGKKKSSSNNLKNKEDAFYSYYDRAAANSAYSDAAWRSFFRDLAYRESGLNGSIVGPALITGKNAGTRGRGYFGIMDYSKGNYKWDTKDPSTLGEQFKNAFWLMDTNMKYLKNHMTPKDYEKAEELGLDMYGLAAGTWAAGPGGVLRILRSNKDIKDQVFGVSTLKRMRDFSGKYGQLDVEDSQGIQVQPLQIVYRIYEPHYDLPKSINPELIDAILLLISSIPLFNNIETTAKKVQEQEPFYTDIIPLLKELILPLVNSTYSPLSSVMDTYNELLNLVNLGNLHGDGGTLDKEVRNNSAQSTPIDKKYTPWIVRHYNKWRDFLIENNVPEEDAQKQALIFAALDGLESNAGLHKSAREGHNYGGMQLGGKNIAYNSDEEYMQAKYKMMQERFGHALNSTSPEEYALLIGTPGEKGYIYFGTDKVKYNPKDPAWIKAQLTAINNYVAGMRRYMMDYLKAINPGIDVENNIPHDLLKGGMHFTGGLPLPLVKENIYLDRSNLFYGGGTIDPFKIFLSIREKALGNAIASETYLNDVAPLLAWNTGDKSGYDDCVAFSNNALRELGFEASGDAWDPNASELIWSGYEGLDRPETYDLEVLKKYNNEASNNVLHNFSRKSLDVTKPYQVNMYYLGPRLQGSPALEKAYNADTSVTGTHGGYLVYDKDLKDWVVIHNVHGDIYREKFTDLQGGGKRWGVTAIYEPRKSNLLDGMVSTGRSIIDTAKDWIGFAEGGPLKKFKKLTNNLSNLVMDYVSLNSLQEGQLPRFLKPTEDGGYKSRYKEGSDSTPDMKLTRMKTPYAKWFRKNYVLETEDGSGQNYIYYPENLFTKKEANWELQDMIASGGGEGSFDPFFHGLIEANDGSGDYIDENGRRVYEIDGELYSDDDEGEEYAKGGKIYIKPSKRGTFTAAAKKHGKSVQQFASQVLANKDKYSSAMVKKANFARNAAKWHGYGGNLFLTGGLEDEEGGPLKNLWDKFKDAVQIAQIAESPSVMTAAGQRVNPRTGKVEFNHTNDKDVKRLRENIATIGEMSIMAPTAAKDIELLYNVVRRPVQSYKAAKKGVQSGYKYLKDVVSKKPNKITLKNAAVTTDAEWDAAYNAAVESGNIAEAQRLRDLHFKVKAPKTKAIDSNGNPIETYHTVADRYDPNFKEFNPEIEGSHSSVYTSDNSIMSGTYTNDLVSEEELNFIAELMRKNELYNILLGYSILDPSVIDILLDPEAGIEWIKNNSWLKGAKVNPARQKRLFVNLENPVLINNNESGWNNINLSDLPEDVYKNIKEDYQRNLLNSSYTTRSLEAALKSTGKYDGAIIRRVLDYGPSSKSFFIKRTPGTVYQVNSPNNLKLADAITYADDGTIIPLSQRDNFSIRDMRYALIPALFGTGLLDNLTEENLEN